MSIFNFFTKRNKEADKESLDKGVSKTRDSFLSKISRALVGRSSVDESFLDELEEILVSSDVGVETTVKIIEKIEARVKRDKFISQNELNTLLREEIVSVLSSEGSAGNGIVEKWQGKKTLVLMVVGVNGVGKTTTIGKLAHQFVEEGKKVLLVGADTFRAAAVDQLKIWADRTGASFFSKGMNADPAAVAFDGLKIGVEQGFDVVIVDTAGRLHNKVNLMNELSKIRRIMAKVMPDAPHDVLLVLDATTGQNAFEQAKQFTAATEVSGLVLTKLDGTARGGVVLGISAQFNVPVTFIGVGEGMKDLQVFNPVNFVNSLFNE